MQSLAGCRAARNGNEIRLFPFCREATMNNTIARTESALPLSDDHGKVIGYFFPARTYERWQSRFADLNRQLNGSPQKPSPAPANGAAAPGPVPFDELLDMLKGLADADRLRLLLELK